MGQGLIWAAYKGHLLEQNWKNRIRELDLQAVHMRSLWKLKWERRLQLCLRLGDASSQILSWMGNLYVEWWYTISKELLRTRVYSPNLWKYPKATSFTEEGVDDVAVLDRRTATR